jgi:hypothetical protein
MKKSHFLVIAKLAADRHTASRRAAIPPQPPRSKLQSREPSQRVTIHFSRIVTPSNIYMKSSHLLVIAKLAADRHNGRHVQRELRGGATHASSPPPVAKIQKTTQRRCSMRWLRIGLLSLLAHTLFAQGAPPQAAADQPYVMEYYYKVQWGRQQEFLRLFLRNHYPLLRKQVDTGRIVAVKIEQPANHGTEDGRWDYRVTIRFKNSTVATTANPDEPRLLKQLWPDQDTYQREEQRRFEILLAHWDLPVTDITPAAK